MKAVCNVLGVARSATAVKQRRSPGWQDGHRARSTNDVELVAQIQAPTATGVSGRCCGAAAN